MLNRRLYMSFLLFDGQRKNHFMNLHGTLLESLLFQVWVLTNLEVNLSGPHGIMVNITPNTQGQKHSKYTFFSCIQLPFAGSIL